jgi:hypothetical protein
MKRPSIPAWIRHGVEAGAIGALLSCATLVAFKLSRPAPRLELPNGLDGAMILLPAVLALGVFAVCYPTFMAATRADAVLGSVAALLVAADVLMAVSLASRDDVIVHALGRSLPLGLVAAVLAIPAAAVALIVGPATSAIGFGRSAGLRAATAAAVVGLVFVIAGALTI